MKNCKWTPTHRLPARNFQIWAHKASWASFYKIWNYIRWELCNIFTLYKGSNVKSVRVDKKQCEWTPPHWLSYSNFQIWAQQVIWAPFYKIVNYIEWQVCWGKQKCKKCKEEQETLKVDLTNRLIAPNFQRLTQTAKLGPTLQNLK